MLALPPLLALLALPALPALPAPTTCPAPMIEWIAKKVKDRITRGRIAVLENPATSRAYKLESLADLDGIEDGLLDDTYFDYVIGDQCMLGQHDRRLCGQGFTCCKLGPRCFCCCCCC